MRIRSVLCPIDFSDASRTALRMAARLVRQFGAALHVLFVEDALLAVGSGEPGPASLKDELSQFVASTPDLDLAAEPVLHLAAGPPADEIVRLARRARMDGIVMGTHGLTGVRKAFFGSTAARVLKRSTIPLWMVPLLAEGDRARNLEGLGSILVLTDFGPAAACAADEAARLAEITGARLILMHVVPPVSAPAGWTSRARAVMEVRTADAHRRMCAAMVPLERFGAVESVIVQGNTAGCAADVARTRHAGLIVMGLERGARSSRPGSTAYAVICNTPAPVLVVPAAA